MASLQAVLKVTLYVAEDMEAYSNQTAGPSLSKQVTHMGSKHAVSPG